MWYLWVGYVLTVIGGCNVCEVSGSEGDEYEDGCLLERCAVYSGKK
jgi:hypothetical protein